MSEYIETPITEDNMKQHKAYIQSWISAIRNNKNYLFKAISKAEEASEYMIEKAELDKILEKFENEELSLDDSIAEYEKAIKLIKDSEKLLEVGEGKVLKVLEKNGKLETEEVE